MPFTDTGDWDNWTSLKTETFLKKGSNRVKLESTGKSGANIDHLRLQRIVPAATEGQSGRRRLHPGKTFVAGGTRVKIYPASPLHRNDGVVSGTVNGEAVWFESFRTSSEYYYDVTYAWFAADGRIDCELEIDAPVQRAHLGTVLKDLPVERNGSVLRFTLPGPVRNCKVQDVVTNTLVPSRFGGLAGAPLDGLTFKNVTVNVEPPHCKNENGKPYLFNVGRYVNLAIENLTVNWQGHKNLWAGITSGPGIEIEQPGQGKGMQHLPILVPGLPQVERTLNDITWAQLHHVVVPDPNPADRGLVLDLKDDTLSGSIFSGPYPFEAGSNPENSYYPYTRYDEQEALRKGVGQIHIQDFLEEGTDENANNWPQGQYAKAEDAPTMTVAYRVSLAPDGDFYDGRRSFFCDGPCGKKSSWKPQLTIVEGPFVNKLTSDERITPAISLETDKPSICTVEIPSAGKFTGKKSRRHEIELAGLSPDTEYSYNVTCKADGQTVRSGRYTFRTAPEAGSGGSFRFAFASDSREGQAGGEAQFMGHNHKTLSRIATDAYREGADFFIFGGDLVNGYTTGTEDFKLQLKGWKKSMEGFWRSSPVFTVMGNHEALLNTFRGGSSGTISFDKWPYHKESAEAVFAQEFFNPENGPEPSDERRPPYCENVYKFQFGSALFIAFNNNYWWTSRRAVSKYGGAPQGYIMQDQLKWIEKTMQEAEKDSTVKYVFLFAQEPVFPTGGHPEDAMWYHGDNNVRAYTKHPSGDVIEAGPGIIEVRNQFVEAISSSSKLVAVLVGDEHLYSRMKVTKSTPVGVYPKDDRDGDGVLEKPYSPNPGFKHSFWSVTAGNAGAPWYSNEQVPWVPETIVSRLGYLLFEVSEAGVTMTAKALRGDEIIEKVRLKP